MVQHNLQVTIVGTTTFNVVPKVLPKLGVIAHP